MKYKILISIDITKQSPTINRSQPPPDSVTDDAILCIAVVMNCRYPMSIK